LVKDGYMKTKNSAYKQGTIVENLPNTMFRVDLGDGKIVLASLKGSLRKRYVRLYPGDRVTVEMSIYDADRGRIVEKNS